MHDANVGLVRHQPIDIYSCFTCFGQHSPRGIFQHTHGQLEHRLAVHFQCGVTQHLPTTDRARHAQNARVFAVCMDVSCQNTGARAIVFTALQHHSARAITKQHAGGAVIEVEDAREHLSAHHQCFAGGPSLDERVSHRQRINKAAAHRLNIKRCTTGATRLTTRQGRLGQFVLQDGCGRWKHHVGR